MRDSKGKFTNGHKPLGGMKGKKHSLDTKIKISKKNKGKRMSKGTEFKKGNIPWSKENHKDKSYEELYGKEKSDKIKSKISNGNKGKVVSEEAKKKMSNFWKGKSWVEGYGVEGAKDMRKKRLKYLKGRTMSEEHKRKIIEANTGRVCSVETRKKISFANKGNEKIKSARAKQVCPKRDTTIEIKIQGFLNKLGIKFIPHRYMKEIEHGYQCDMFIPSMNLIIECDGNYWHNFPNGNELDIKRTRELIGKEFIVLRFWESEIKVITLDEFEYKLITILNRNGGKK